MNEATFYCGYIYDRIVILIDKIRCVLSLCPKIYNEFLYLEYLKEYGTIIVQRSQTFLIFPYLQTYHTYMPQLHKSIRCGVFMSSIFCYPCRLYVVLSICSHNICTTTHKYTNRKQEHFGIIIQYCIAKNRSNFQHIKRTNIIVMLRILIIRIIMVGVIRHSPL